MSLLIVTILLIGYILIATENYTNVNKAAVAIFVGTVGWVLYISFGTDFVMKQHQEAYLDFLAGGASSATTVKQFIAQSIFLRYVGKAAEIVLFLISTMTIVEILNNNGCFDFIGTWARTRNSRSFLWTMSLSTFIISANLDNLTTIIMSLTVIHKLVPNRRYRMIYGGVALLAANCGGALTVIGSPEGLVLWNIGAITATNYSAYMLLPCLAAWIIPTWWIGRDLPEHIEMEQLRMPYRGDDTNLNVWQRLLMLFVGIGGLWFIPTFHNITQLSPFLGALCVLSVLWVVNEIFNRKLINAEDMIQRRIPRMLQYGVIQMILFVMGVMLALGVVGETGVLQTVARYIDIHIHNVWIIGIICGLISTTLDNFATAMTAISLYPIVDGISDGSYLNSFIQNGIYWKIVAFTSAIGGNVLPIGSVGGMFLLSSERMHVGWFFRHIGCKAMVGGIVGMIIMWVIL